MASQYIVQTGIRSTGVFPYTGTDVTLRSNKINFDDYNWIVNNDNRNAVLKTAITEIETKLAKRFKIK